ncbi:hypothetical protein GTQ40_14475 [Flavobacteriaceae bacterium R38]|nr:hypothetical protein [Flavobacteriaceae bacterium R38]
MRKIIFIIIASLFFKISQAQQNDAQALFYNVGIHSVFSGIGAVINKKPNDKFGKTFLKGFAQGALGGYLVFESKRLIRTFYREDDFVYVWPSKVLNAAGTSITENAVSNINFWEKWHLNIGFNRFEINTKEKFKLKYRIMPFALAGTIVTASQGKFDFERSLKTGTFVFTTDFISPNRVENARVNGRVPLFTNSVLILNNQAGDDALAHELIHTYQYESFSFVNSYLDKPLNDLFANTESGFLKTYNKIFYTDFNFLVVNALFGIEDLNSNTAFDNFFEREADYYSNRFRFD